MTPLNGLTPRRRLLVAMAGLSVALLGPAACASSPAAGPALVRLSVVDRETGQTLPVYAQEARRYVAGTPGSRYSLRVTNRTGGRVLVVLSVDGVNIVSGQTANWNQVGYVLEPWRTYDIVGWRKSDTQVAAFEFAALRDSYAALTGRPDHVGVIGMAVFTEKPADPALASSPTLGEAVRRAAPAAPPAPEAALAKAATAAAADASSARLGTAHGERELSVARRTSFERASTHPQLVTEYWYDSRENLIAAGVIPHRFADQRRAFPRSEPDPGFVPDPPRQ